MPQDLTIVNGRIMPAQEACVSVLDLGFLRGVGAFETFRTYGGGCPHALDEHLRRLWDSCAAFGVGPVVASQALRALLREVHRMSGHAELRVNLIVTPGINTSGVFGAEQPTWVAIARDVHAPPPEHYRDGVAAVTFAAARLLPLLKTTSYLVGKTGLMAAERAGAHEAFYLDKLGNVTEGVTSNVLIRIGTEVVTPVADCLPGITKAGIRPLVEAEGLRWRERALPLAELLKADEVWITSAVRELLPIVRVDGTAIADGRPGRWAMRLHERYHEHCVLQARRDAGLD